MTRIIDTGNRVVTQGMQDNVLCMGVSLSSFFRNYSGAKVCAFVASCRCFLSLFFIVVR